MNAVIFAVVIAIVGAVAVPLFETASGRAELSALLRNLHTLRSQIELYKAEHDGRPPVAYQGTFPQLIKATNDAGIPGPPGPEFPHGPYLRGGVPVNSMTGRSIVTLTETFPPDSPSGNGGWIYHQASGQIAADTQRFLTE